MLLAATNSGTLIIALPDLERSLHTSLLALVWVILAYLIAATVLVLMAGRLSDLFGRKRAYVGGFLLFAFASLGAGFAGNGTELILWRILQGISSSFLFANAAALVTDAFPKEQLGLAMGANTMVAAIGLVLGPVLGGALVAISWHWVFWFNVPLALAGAAWGAVILRELAKPDDVRGYDVLGTCTFIVGFTGLVLGVSKGGISGWNNPVVIIGLAAAAVLLPLWVAIERRSRAPMLDLTLFRNRLFAAASAAAFINGLARFALMFLFVFYFQGAQGDSPIDAGIKLGPLALGMLVASPIAGMYADRHGSRALASIGMLVTAAGLAGMTTLQVSSAYGQSALWLALVGIGSGMFNSPNTAAMMGVVPAKRRGIAAGARTLLQNTGGGAVDRLRARGGDLLDPQKHPLRGLLRARQGPLPREARALHLQHARRPLGAVGRLGAGGARVPAAPGPRRPRDAGRCGRRRALRELAGGRGVSASAARSEAVPPPPAAGEQLRIGDVARLVETTPRTIRYYEQLGLLPTPASRAAGAHRTYSPEEVERLREVMRLKELLGLSLEELGTLLAAEEARAAVRAQLRRDDVDPDRRRELLNEALGHIDRQLELVRRRASELGKLESELNETRKRVRRKLRGQDLESGPRPVSDPQAEGAQAAMTSTAVQPSPEGVPGAVTDTSGLQGESLTFSGSGGQAINGYLASPARNRALRRDDRDPRGDGPQRAHPRHLQPPRPARLLRPRRGPLHARRRPAAAG